MSVESAKAFIEKMKTDEDFARQVSECKNNDARMAFVRDAGFDFTTQEIQESRIVLDDDNLDLASGGVKAKCCWSGFIEFIN